MRPDPDFRPGSGQGTRVWEQSCGIGKEEQIMAVANTPYLLERWVL